MSTIGLNNIILNMQSIWEYQTLLSIDNNNIRDAPSPAPSNLTQMPNPSTLIEKPARNSIPIPSSSHKISPNIPIPNLIEKPAKRSIPIPSGITPKISPSIPIPKHPDSIKLDLMCQKMDSLFHGRGHSHCLPQEVVQNSHQKGFWLI